jgi:asparaginyl-tRNA synthetase
MTEFTIARAAEFDGKEVELRGWLYNKRASGKLIFPIFRDGTGLMQAVVSKAEVSPEVWERAGSLTQETSLIARGTVRADKRAPGGYELVLRDLEIVQVVPVDDPYPISPKDHGVDFLLSHRHLWVRSARQAALLRLRHGIILTSARPS